MNFRPIPVPENARNYATNSAANRLPSTTGEGFALVNNEVTFAPLYPPSGFAYTKDRDPNRNKNSCEGEDIADSGGKNREVRVSGKMRQRERPLFERLVDSTEPFMLTTFGWSGEVRLGDGNKYRGPVGFNEDGDLLWEYTLNLISTGKHEYEDFKESGIIE